MRGQAAFVGGIKSNRKHTQSHRLTLSTRAGGDCGRQLRTTRDAVPGVCMCERERERQTHRHTRTLTPDPSSSLVENRLLYCDSEHLHTPSCLSIVSSGRSSSKGGRGR